MGNLRAPSAKGLQDLARGRGEGAYVAVYAKTQEPAVLGKMRESLECEEGRRAGEAGSRKPGLWHTALGHHRGAGRQDIRFYILEKLLWPHGEVIGLRQG